MAKLAEYISMLIACVRQPTNLAIYTSEPYILFMGQRENVIPFSFTFALRTPECYGMFVSALWSLNVTETIFNRIKQNIVDIHI